MIVIVVGLCPAAVAQTTDDLVFIHHSCGRNWLDNSLHAALLAKDYIDERNDIYYGTDISPDAGRPDSLAPTPGDKTNMNHWIRWLNDYLNGIKAHGCADGANKIIMFKSCYPISNITSDGTEPGDPFSSSQTLTNYKAVYRHPSGPGSTYLNSGYTYKPLEDIFAENPNTLFIPVTAPPRHYAPSDATNDAEAHRARLFNNWLKNDWLASYNAAHPDLNNVAVFDWFDVLAYADDHATHPNRLKAEYGGASGDSHPNATANADSTAIFATDPGNLLDTAWSAFTSTTSCQLAINITNEEWGSVILDPEPNDPNLPTYPIDASVTLTAMPDPNRSFKHWKLYDPNYPGDTNHIALDTNLSTTIIMSTDREVTAVFTCSSGVGAELGLLIPLVVAGAASLIRRRR
jgi:hypothetical protein